MHYKKCSVCKEEKPHDCFNKSNLAKSGLTSACKLCRAKAREIVSDKIKKQKAAWYYANKEVVLQKAKDDRRDNPEKHKNKEAEKYLKNRDKIIKRVSEFQKRCPEVYRKAGKKYRKSTPEKQAAKAAKRRARLLKATPSWTSDEFEQFYIQEIYHLAQLHREITGIDFHIDHIVPLTSKFVCGLHCSANLRLLTSIENVRKLNRHWPDMWE